MKYTLDRSPLALAGVCAAFAVAACSPANSGGSTGSGSTSGSNGIVSFALKSAVPPAVASLTAAVAGIRIGKMGGTTTSALSAPITLDLAQTTDISRLLQSANLGADTYDLVEITLDFTHSTVVTRSGPATLVGAGGFPFAAPFTIDIDLNQSAFQLTAGEQHLVELDVDAASATTMDQAHAELAIDPIVSIVVDRAQAQVEIVGQLSSVSPSALVFGAALESSNAAVGSVELGVDPHTLFQIDGVPSAGQAGIASLALKQQGTPLELTAEIDPSSPKLFASFVIAGLGTANGGTDIVDGEVVDRLGNPSPGSNVTLKVVGNARNALGTLMEVDAPFAAVVNFANTHVVRSRSVMVLDADDLNVGQHVRVFGTLNGGVIYANLGTNLVREDAVQVFGFATTASAPVGGPVTLTMSLDHVDELLEQSFVWLDSGLLVPNPAAFTVNAGSLIDPAQVTSDEAIGALGFFAPTGDAAQDFLALSLATTASAPTQLVVSDKPGGFTVTVDANSARIMLTIAGSAGAGEKAVLDQGLMGSMLLPTTPAPTVVAASPLGNYTLQDKTTATASSFTAFNSFSSALTNALSSGAALSTFTAEGTYSSSTNSLRATTISALVE